MNKVTKRELLRRIEALEEWSIGADEMLTELNHALPDPEYDAKCAENAIAVEESLDRHAARLGLNKPQLKQLDQSVFDGADPKYITAATNEDGRTFLFPVPKSELEHALGCWFSDYRGDSPRVDGLFDSSDWQNSLIERKELTGSDLARAMLARGDTYIKCFCHNDAELSSFSIYEEPYLITKYWEKGCFSASDSCRYKYAIPINNQGEPLTASEVGL